MSTRKAHIALEGKGLSLGYVHQKQRKEILSDLNFQLISGELTCLLGPNGVGKSTLIKAILGQITPWKGTLSLENQPISSFDLKTLAKKIAVVLTDPVFPGNMTVGQLVALGRTPYTGWSGKLSLEDHEIVEKALSDTKITYLKEERLSEISDGQRQKAMIARALAQDGDILILDEPTAHLDLVNRFEIMTLLREIAKNQDHAVLVVTHDLDIALETADRFWLLNCGTPLIADRPESLILNGSINQLLPGEKYAFNLSRGKVEAQLLENQLKIKGPKEQVFWVEKALLKAGISRLEHEVSVLSEPFTIQTEKGNFSSLDSFIQSLDS
ncbi:iron complex transport system ATP-binding protein [Algoriphagus boseongensis]|uniref:Iron complex transport system ATP-binding protein n=1 Tax=Algoriphagus boseongensis TaxID=1442587 RepID=A0A4R6T6V4_9BACT|nr:ABC transporter ATP-binding protein [Algoriphagus boseongensis]TDQ16390.1 iron complex transport system ATP-binding protein [Algoriphagus boseongensis]